MNRPDNRPGGTAPGATPDATPDAIALLTGDHRRVRQLFDEYEEIAGQAEQEDLQSELAEQICFELSVHALVEQEIFYPAVRAAIDDDELIDEAEAEHASVKDLIGQLEDMQAGEARFDALVKVLSEQVEHHVSEEEGGMFAKVRHARLDLDGLGRQIGVRRQEIENDFNGAPAPEKIRNGNSDSRKPAQP